MVFSVSHVVFYDVIVWASSCRESMAAQKGFGGMPGIIEK